MYQLPARRSLWDRRAADRLERMTTHRRTGAAAALTAQLGLR